MISSIQGKNEYTLENTSGYPSAQGIPQDTMPCSTLPADTRGPPESPWQAPSPARVKVHTWLSKTGLGDCRDWHSVTLRVVKLSCCRLLGTLPGYVVVPQPAKTTLSSAPMLEEGRFTKDTLLLSCTGVESRRRATSLLIKLEL